MLELAVRGGRGKSGLGRGIRTVNEGERNEICGWRERGRKVLLEPPWPYAAVSSCCISNYSKMWLKNDDNLLVRDSAGCGNLGWTQLGGFVI